MRKAPLKSPTSSSTAPSIIPLRVSFELWEIDFCRLHLIQLDEKPLALEWFWPTGITPDLVAFIAKECRCAYCRAPISEFLDPCSCGKAKRRGYTLVAAFPRELARAAWRVIYDRESVRANRRRRRQALIAAGGSFLDARRLPQLLEVQEHRCYYCASPLVKADGSPNFHRDHFEPVARGGTSSLHNIVLTCPRCNYQKGVVSGLTFESRTKKLRSAEAGAWLRGMRKRLVQWRATTKDPSDD